MDDQEKAEMGTQTFIDFCQQFGDDVYSCLLLEVLFDELLKLSPELIHGGEDEETISVLGEQIETGNEAGNSAPERVNCDLQAGESGNVEPSINMATPDLPDYP